MKSIIVVVIAIFLSSCASVEHRDVGVVEYSLGVGQYTSSLARLDDIKTNEEVTLIFPTIPGAIFGAPSKDILFTAVTSLQSKFTLRLPQALPERAKAFSSAGLSITPIDTKVLRLGTFHYYSDYEVIGGGGFANKKTGGFLSLVYFSKPSVVTGVVFEDQEKVEFKVTVKKSGWSWVKSIKISENNRIVTEYTGSLEDVEFAIIVPDETSI